MTIRQETSPPPEWIIRFEVSPQNRRMIESLTVAKEFLHSHVPGCSNRCELRIGDPAQHIIETARSESVDAIVVAWNQDLAPGKADVVRRLLGEAKVPLLIVPIGLN